MRFFPELLSIMAENSLRTVCHRLKEDHPPYSPSKHFLSLLASNQCAMHVACTYALHLLERRELRSLTLILPLIAAGFSQSEGVELPDVFLHILVVQLTGQPEAIRDASLQVGRGLRKRGMEPEAVIRFHSCTGIRVECPLTNTQDCTAFSLTNP